MLRIVRPRVDSEPVGATNGSELGYKTIGRQPSRIALAVKRGLDVSLSVTFGLLALPAMAVIALAIRMDSPGPALFRTTRVGRHGKHFPMLKFRTMVADAEKRFHEIAHLNMASGMVKIPDDPRVTRLGKWLRRFSLDELPQLYNVLVGHMSIVGPRPHDVGELSSVGIERNERLSMKPGLTGLWQVVARSDPRIEARIHNDLMYVQRWSLLLDAKILAMTVPVVIFGKGGMVDGENNVMLSKVSAPSASASPIGTVEIATDVRMLTVTGNSSAE